MYNEDRSNMSPFNVERNLGDQSLQISQNMSNILNNMQLDQSLNEYKSQEDNSRVYEDQDEIKEKENEVDMDFEEE